MLRLLGAFLKSACSDVAGYGLGDNEDLLTDN